VASTAHKIPVLIGGTALVGIAGAVQLLLPVLMGELVANRQRPLLVGSVWTSSIPFSMFGPIIARLLVVHTSAGWRWCYYLNIIITGLVVVLLTIFYHPPTLKMLHSRQKRRALDYLDTGGIALFSVGLALFILGLSWGGQQYAWNSGEVIGTIVAGGILLIVFTVYGESYDYLIGMYQCLYKQSSTCLLRTL
jgi:MFS family permease